MTTFRKQGILKNLLSGSAVTLVAQGLALAMVTFLTRTLGPESYGRISMGTSIVAYFVMAVTIGLPTIGTRIVARDHDHAKQTWWEIAVLRLLLAAMAYLVLVLCAYGVTSFHPYRLLLLLYGLLLFPTALSPDWVYLGLERMAAGAWGLVLANVVGLGLSLALIKGPQSVLLVPLITVTSAGVSVGYLIITLFSQTRLWDVSTSLHAAAKLLKLTRPFVLASVLSMIFGNADLIALGYFRGATEAGLYGAAYKIINLLASLIALISQATYPAMARRFAEGPVNRNGSAMSTTVGMFAALLPIAAGGTVLAPQLVSFLFGTGYIQASRPLAILLWYIFASGLSISYSNALLAANEDKTYSQVIILGCVVDLVLIIAWIPRWGTVGAATAMVIAEAFILVYLMWRARAILGLKFVDKKSACAILLSVAVMVATVSTIRGQVPVVISISVGALVYGVCLLGIASLFGLKIARH